MDTEETKINIMVLASLIAILGLVFFVSQTEENPGPLEKVLYVISTFVIFYYIAAGFLRNKNLMKKTAMIFSVVVLGVVVSHLPLLWIPTYMKAITLILSFTSFVGIMKTNYTRHEENNRKNDAISIIDLTKSTTKVKNKKNTSKKKQLKRRNRIK